VASVGASPGLAVGPPAALIAAGTGGVELAGQAAAEAGAASESAVGPEAEAESDSESDSESEADSQSDSDSEADSESESEADSDADSEAGAEREAGGREGPGSGPATASDLAVRPTPAAAAGQPTQATQPASVLPRGRVARHPKWRPPEGEDGPKQGNLF
jgi:hypothetical protein